MQIIAREIKEKGSFPNNNFFPIIIYKNILHEIIPEFVKELFSANDWRNAWNNSIYSFHHYHSNAHEVLGICEGSAIVQLGGPDGPVFMLQASDVLIIPAGISHKSLDISKNLMVVGAYARDVKYNMKYGQSGERPSVDKEIRKVLLPKCDPVFGLKGPLFKYWR